MGCRLRDSGGIGVPATGRGRDRGVSYGIGVPAVGQRWDRGVSYEIGVPVVGLGWDRGAGCETAMGSGCWLWDWGDSLRGDRALPPRHSWMPLALHAGSAVAGRAPGMFRGSPRTLQRLPPQPRVQASAPQGSPVRAPSPTAASGRGVPVPGGLKVPPCRSCALLPGAVRPPTIVPRPDRPCGAGDTQPGPRGPGGSDGDRS